MRDVSMRFMMVFLPLIDLREGFSTTISRKIIINGSKFGKRFILGGEKVVNCCL